jgi:protein TonB
MTPSNTALPGTANGRLPASTPPGKGRRWLLAAVALSVLLHLVPLGVYVALPRGAPKPNSLSDQGAVELLMVERKGAEPSQQGQPAQPAQAAQPPAKQVPAKPDAAGEAVPAQSVPAPSQPASQAQSPAGPVFDLAGTDSDSNAEVLAGRVLPAMPDDRFRNRPPPYPLEAEIAGEAGEVVVIIHVSAYGVATGADLEQSSGSASLDQAALTAVRKWHFHPAMKEGQAVPFDMPFRFVFSAR